MMHSRSSGGLTRSGLSSQDSRSTYMQGILPAASESRAGIARSRLTRLKSGPTLLRIFGPASFRSDWIVDCFQAAAYAPTNVPVLYGRCRRQTNAFGRNGLVFRE